MGRIEREQRVVGLMIGMYCTAHHQKEGLCNECNALKNYALERLTRCPFLERKKACKKCPTHCYRPQMREQIRAAMRYAGPRMIAKHPVAALRHLLNC